MLRTRFLTSVQSDNATYEIASAVIKRSNKPKNTWESVQFEVPAHRFADLSQTDFGVALLNDSKYGYRIQENEMELNLLRSPADVDPTADIHSHSYQYAIYPHTKSYENSDVLPIAHQFNMPLYLVKCEFETQIPTPFGINIDSTRIKIDVVKPAYDTKAIALRLYEFTGSCVDAKLHVPSQYGYIYRSDMKEKSMQLFGNTNPILLSFKPFEIITLVLCGAQL